MKKSLISEFFVNTHELFNRSFDKSEQNTPARIMDEISTGNSDKGCQCVSCQSCDNSCNK